MAIGILYLFLTFVICFILVHVVKLAYIGLKSVRKKPEAPKEKPAPEPKPKKPEPVYYIVEKKKAKKSYSAPKEIQFKD
ncbi:MAG: hypothetical protein K2J83_05770 [Clostridia bacterium]|nr:hypothetical protein [Clostridia bacterium]